MNKLYIRLGTLPLSGKSINKLTGKVEEGISVFPAKQDLQTGNILFESQDSTERLHKKGAPSYDHTVLLVTGNVVGYGSDKEPLLSNTKVLSTLKYNPKTRSYKKIGMKKQAGLLDQPRDTLDFSVGTPGRKLRPDIRRIMIDRIYGLLDPGMVKAMYIIGSITGYKYKPTSDIDVNVHIDPFDDSIAKSRLTKEINEQPVGDTEHPINYFIQPYTPKTSGQDSYYGVYDVLEDEWIVYPPPRKDVRDPQEQYRDELMHGVWLARRFEKRVKEFCKDLRALKQLQELAKSGKWIHRGHLEKKRNEVDEDFRGLIQFVKNTSGNRKLRYSLGWGIPRNTTANVVYKHISKGPYADFFHTLEPLDIDAKIQA